jgi:twitching motility protein PilU
VILVGEMRDLETIRLALTGAETGHLVFATLHTSSAAKTIDRVIDVFPAAEKEMVRSMLSESLRAVISQTLLKTKDGQGRVAAHEILIGTPAIRNLIRENKVAQMYSTLQTGQQHGMQTLDQCLVDTRPTQCRFGSRGAQQGGQQRRFPGLYSQPCEQEEMRGNDQALRFMHELLRLMTQKNGSDLFITANFPPAIKIDGKVVPVSNQPLLPQHSAELARSIMNDRQASDFEATKECNFAISPTGIGRFRVNALVQQGKVAVVCRTINLVVPTLDELGLPPVLKDIAMTLRGLVVFVGGTGTGKTTSLAALVDHRNRNSQGHIITIEDPIEFVHEHKKCIVTQREIGVDTDSWEIALKNTLRQAPNVIMMGEIRDRATMDYAIAFAETGHLCLATLHANSTNQAIDRIINFFPEERRHQLLMDLSLNLRAWFRSGCCQEGRQGTRPGDRDHAQLATDFRPHLQGPGAGNQGGDEKVARTGHADLRPGAVRSLRSRPDQLHRCHAQRRLAQRPAPADQAAWQGIEGPGSDRRHRSSGHHLTCPSGGRKPGRRCPGRNRLLADSSPYTD